MPSYRDHEKIPTVPPEMPGTPLYKGKENGETLREGLPKRLPNGLPMHTYFDDGESFGETIGESFGHGLPMPKPLATGRFTHMMGRRWVIFIFLIE